MTDILIYVEAACIIIGRFLILYLTLTQKTPSDEVTIFLVT